MAIADTPWLGMRENRFIDRPAAGFSFWFRRVGFRNRLDRLGFRRGFRTMLRGGPPFGLMDGEGVKLGAEGLLDMFGVNCIELVLVRQPDSRSPTAIPA